MFTLFSFLNEKLNVKLSNRHKRFFDLLNCCYMHKKTCPILYLKVFFYLNKEIQKIKNQN